MLFQGGGPYTVERTWICTMDGRGHPLPIRRPIGPLRYRHCILRLLLRHTAAESVTFRKWLVLLNTPGGCARNDLPIRL